MEGGDVRSPVKAGIGRVRGKTSQLLGRKVVRSPLRRQLSKVSVERTILFRHEDDVLDGIDAETISDTKVTPMPRGGLIVMFDSALYRVDERKRIVWKYTTGQIMFEFTYVPLTGLIYGTAGDGVMFILNAMDGKKVFGDSYQGRGAYDMARAYGKDQCLITSNYSAYRDWERFDPTSLKDGPTTWRDEITAFRGTKVLWSRDFPPDADLVVDGKRIFAVTKTKSSIYVMEVSVPTTSTIR